MNIPIFTPDTSTIIHAVKVDFITRSFSNPIHVVQYDNLMPVIEVELYKNCNKMYLNNDYTECNIRFIKPDGSFVHNNAVGRSEDYGKFYFEVTNQMVTVSGNARAVIELVEQHTSTRILVGNSSSFDVIVDRNPIGYPAQESTNEWEVIADVVKKAEEVEVILDEQEETTKLTLLNALLLSILYSNKIFDGDYYKIITFDDPYLYSVESGEAVIIGNNRIIG